MVLLRRIGDNNDQHCGLIRNTFNDLVFLENARRRQ